MSLDILQIPNRHWICYGVFLYAAFCMPFMNGSSNAMLQSLQHDAPPVHMCTYAIKFSDWRHNPQRIKKNAGKAVADLSLGLTALQVTLVFHQQTLKIFLWAMSLEVPAAAQKKKNSPMSDN